MGGVSHADLVAAVSDAGGMGVLGATFMTPEEIRREISAVREQTDRPFGVNLLIPGDIPPSKAAHETPTFPDFLQDLLAEVEGLSYELPPPLTLELPVPKSMPRSRAASRRLQQGLERPSG